MKIAASLIVLAAGCGGGERMSAARKPPPLVSTPVPAEHSPPEPLATEDVSPHGASMGPRFDDAPLPPVTPQPPAKGCDATVFLAEGRGKLASGMPAHALAAFERALVCVHDPNVEKLAVMAACKAKLYSRARAHFIRVPEPQRAELAEICGAPHS